MKGKDLMFNSVGEALAVADARANKHNKPFAVGFWGACFTVYSKVQAERLNVKVLEVCYPLKSALVEQFNGRLHAACVGNGEVAA